MEKTNQKLLPLSSDIVFKRVFSREGTEDILKDFLEAILNIKIKKVEVKIQNCQKIYMMKKQEYWT